MQRLCVFHGVSALHFVQCFLGRASSGILSNSTSSFVGFKLSCGYLLLSLVATRLRLLQNQLVKLHTNPHQ